MDATELILRDIDVHFDARRDTPTGKDPDRFSPTRRGYHRLLWSKPLSDGTMFTLSSAGRAPYLLHESSLGRIELSSDLIVNNHRRRLRRLLTDENMPRINKALGPVRWSVAGTIVFPSNRAGRNQTINMHRGIHHQIHDRFDLTLECIRRHYAREPSPLAETMNRYADFFSLFRGFAGYTDFFFLQDLVRDDGAVRFYLPFQGFRNGPLPQDLETYLTYCRRMALFFRARTRRIEQHVRAGLALEQRVLLQACHRWVAARG